MHASYSRLYYRLDAGLRKEARCHRDRVQNIKRQCAKEGKIDRIAGFDFPLCNILLLNVKLENYVYAICSFKEILIEQMKLERLIVQAEFTLV